MKLISYQFFIKIILGTINGFIYSTLNFSRYISKLRNYEIVNVGLIEENIFLSFIIGFLVGFFIISELFFLYF